MRMRGSQLWCIFSRSSCSMTMRENGFTHLGLSDSLVYNLTQKSIVHPTDIQIKALPRILEGRHVVLNAETGSGKTLCFLLPIIQRQLTMLSGDDSCKDIRGHQGQPLGLVLVPTPDLVNQVSSIYQELSSLQSAMIYGKRSLLLKGDVGLVVATPTSLLQYDLNKVLKNVGVVCCDEADVLLAGGERVASWKILERIRKIHRENVISHNKAKGKQMIFSAATLPTNSPKSIGRVLSEWLPKKTIFINTERTHRVLPEAQITFEDISCTDGASGSAEQKAELYQTKLKLLSDRLLQGSSPERVMVFCNTVRNCQMLMKSLQSGGCGHLSVASLNKSIPSEDRFQLIKGLNEGLIDVLICTDLASRGLDMMDVDHVIMFDFPRNSADFLHRAGRTARAGKSGKVLALVSDDDRDIATEIRRVMGEIKHNQEHPDTTTGATSFDEVFSRNKMLRRKIKQKEQLRIEN